MIDDKTLIIEFLDGDVESFNILILQSFKDRKRGIFLAILYKLGHVHM